MSNICSIVKYEIIKADILVGGFQGVFDYLKGETLSICEEIHQGMV